MTEGDRFLERKTNNEFARVQQTRRQMRDDAMIRQPIRLDRRSRPISDELFDVVISLIASKHMFARPRAILAIIEKKL